MNEINPLLVISPHLDDGVFSCAAWLAAQRKTAVATVFAGPPPCGLLTDWDRRCGFDSSTDARRTRIAEDDVALATLGARPIRLPFLDAQYGRPAPRERIADALTRIAVAYRAAAVMVPLGLFHSDHVLTSNAGVEAMARLPYCTWFAYEDALYRRIDGAVDARLAQLHEMGVAVHPARAAQTPRDAAARCAALKRRAVRCYASQLPALAGHELDDLSAPERFWRLSR